MNMDSYNNMTILTIRGGFFKGGFCLPPFKIEIDFFILCLFFAGIKILNYESVCFNFKKQIKSYKNNNNYYYYYKFSFIN